MRNKLLTKIVVQMVSVVIIIAGVFSFLSTMQTKELEKRVLDKAALFSALLGTHLDKIVGDNLIAYRRLQEAVTRLERESDALEDITIISPEGIILAASAPENVWKKVDPQFGAIDDEVMRTQQPKAIVRSTMDKELVIHTMPLFSAAEGPQRLIGFVRMTARFPSQRGELAGALRSNKNAYFREEATRFANDLSGELEKAMSEVQKNYAYLDGLVRNMLRDEEIKDIKLFSRELRMLLSGSSGKQLSFITEADNELYRQAMQNRNAVSRSIKGRERFMEAANPLYLTLNGRRQIDGAVGIVVSFERMHELIVARRRTIAVMSLVIMCAFILLIGIFFKNTILAPLNELIALTQRISAGDFSSAARVNGDDEMVDLGAAFNRMSGELQKSKREIEEWNRRLQERVEQVGRQLQLKQEQLIESEKMASLGVLSSGIAHEINNPLGIILGHAQMLLKTLRNNKKLSDIRDVEALLAAIEDHAKRCSHIVNSLLQFARTGNVEFRETDIARALEQALVFTGSRLSRKGIEVKSSIAEDLPLIMANAIHLEQVFINIIVNAEHSMSAAGVLTVDAKRHRAEDGHESIVVMFQDTGEGIPEENLKKIFEPFFSTRQPGEGMGLGLSISYGIIKAHGGTIEAMSTVGKGTTMVVTLPV